MSKTLPELRAAHPDAAPRPGDLFFFTQGGDPRAGEVGDLVSTANGARTVVGLLEEELTLAGASVDSTVLIPEGALVFAVSERVTEEVTGATSFDVGIAGTAGKFGATLALTLGSTNRGLIGPDPFYAAEAVRITANGANFTGGKVRIAIHYFMPVPPTG